MTDRDGADPKGAGDRPAALEAREAGGEGRRFSPSIARNRDAVRDAFLAHMPGEGRILEIASGTGEHGAHILALAPGLRWLYSDIDGDARLSQAAWKAAHPERGLEGPITLDVTAEDWPGSIGMPVDAIFCANMIHIAPFAAADGLIRGAGQLLPLGGQLMLYGPFARDGRMVESNARFDSSLKSRDPAWGVRDLDREVLPLAREAGLVLETVVEMPANNLSVIFRRP